MFKISIPDKLKLWNKDQIPKYKIIESKEFETKLQAENYGESQLGCGVMLYNCDGFRAKIIEVGDIDE